MKSFSFLTSPLSLLLFSIQGGNYLGNQNCPAPFQMDMGYGIILIFQSMHCERKAGRSWLPPCLVQQSLAPTWPSSPSAETSLPLTDGTHGTAQLTPSAPGVHCGQLSKEDARRGYGVGGQPSPKLLFAANTSIGESSALRVYEEEQRYTR